jgi:hypothetical protein
MKRCFFIALSLCSLQAHAMWMTVMRTEAATVYMDSSAIVRVGQLKRVWVVYDLNQPDSSGQRSVKSYIEYNCAENTYRTISASSHAQPMGNGPALKALPVPGQPKPVTQDALSRQVYGFACAW